MNWNADDMNLLKTLTGDTGGVKQRWRCLTRNRRMLLLIRKGATRDVLKLYQPQRLRARCVRFLLALIYPFGGAVFLKQLEIDVADESPLGSIETNSNAEAQAVLLGNPAQDARRMIVLLSDSDGRVVVAKVGAHPAARDAVMREHEFIKRWSAGVSSMPLTRDVLEGDNWAAFTSDFLNGANIGIGDIDVVLDVLKDWVSSDSAQSLCSFPRWQEVLDRWPYPETQEALTDACESVALRPSLVHGDLAPWNMIRNQEGALQVIDWESGEAHGIPGWDWVHFLYQTATLVQRKTAKETAVYLKEMLRSEQSQNYLRASGWAGNENWLLKTYLTADQHNDPDLRREVLDCIHANG